MSVSNLKIKMMQLRKSVLIVYLRVSELLFVCLKNDTKCPQVKKMLVKSIGD